MRGLNLKLFSLVAFSFCFVFVGALDAQGWKMFSQQIRDEAQKAKGKSDEAETTTETNDSFAPPTFVDVARQDKNQPEAPSNPNEPQVRRDVASPVSSGGLLDFSDALQDDAAQYLGDAENEPPLPVGTEFAPEPPSYRNLPEEQNDARLNDVCFVSPTKGWAVGDRGVIWQTVDGGATWVLAKVPTDANLFAVSFLDENFGLAVGGRVLPFSRVGQGVILRTIDGGATWGEIATASFPILRDVKILDASSIWLAGDSSTLYPSGLFVSVDSGLEWTAVEGDRRGGWRSILYDPEAKAGIGTTTEGALQKVDGAQSEKDVLSLGTRRVADLTFDPSSNSAWLVGDQGLTLRSSDFGANWAQTPGGLPNDAQNYFDLNSVAASDGLVGAVGTPGTLFFYSEDGGNVWNASPTGVVAPLRKATFFDRSRGWCVGDFGVIIATDDGGRTWRVQRSGGTRAATLGVFGRARDVPFEALVQFAGDEGYLSEIVLAARESNKENLADETPLMERLNEAVVEVGASGATQTSVFVLNSEIQKDSIERILERFDAENDGDGLARFRERLVRILRTWRPSVLLTVDSALDDQQGEKQTNVDLQKANGTIQLLDALAKDAQKLDEPRRDPFQELLLRELPRAIKDAADPTAYPEHMTACRLEPLRVLKVYQVCRNKAQGDANVDADYFCPSLGRPVGEIAGRARDLIGDGSQVKGDTPLKLLYDATKKQNDGGKRVFAGIDAPRGGESRRAYSGALASYTDELASRAGDRRQKTEIASKLARHSAENAQSAALVLARLRADVQGVDPQFAVEYLTAVGREFASVGAWTAAEEAFSIVAQDLASYPESREAIAWLTQYYASGEVARRVQTSREGETNASPNARSSGLRELRLDNADALGAKLREEAPDAYMAPEIRFPLAASSVARGDLEGALKFYWTRAQASRYDAWGVRAATEYWLRAPKGDIRAAEDRFCPVCATTCARTAEKPYLDGAFEPSVWGGAVKLDLSAPYPEPVLTREPTLAEKEAKKQRAKKRETSTNLGTTVSFVRDDEFLYISASCRKRREIQASNSSTKEEEAAPRPRDADLSDCDRLEFQFDLDGDYTTTYKFVFDVKGRLYDALWNAKTWNPEIFVAKLETSEDWSLEIAVPFSALASQTPQNGDVWRLAVRRIAPGVGVECWNVENSDGGEGAFGLLYF